MDNFTSLYRRLLSRAPVLDPLLAQDIVKDQFARLADRRVWSWRRKRNAFAPVVYTIDDTISTLPNIATVTGNLGALLPEMVGKQIRIGGVGYPIYTIIQYNSPTSVVLDRPWEGRALTNSSYAVWTIYFPVPADFQSFYSLVNPSNNYRLWTNITQGDIDMFDSQRIQAGIAFSAAYVDQAIGIAGVVGEALRVVGTSTDPAPISATTYGYSYPESLTYVIRISTAGAPGGALQFQWFVAQYPSTVTTVSVTNNDPIDLGNGVLVYFPTATYTLSDTWVVNCIPVPAQSVPRYELWPRPTTGVYPYIYNIRLPQLSDSSPTLPQFVADRSATLLEMCLAQVARWPGTETRANPYFNLQLANTHQANAETLLTQMEMADDAVAPEDLKYQLPPYFPAPWQDGSWQQRHAIY